MLAVAQEQRANGPSEATESVSERYLYMSHPAVSRSSRLPLYYQVEQDMRSRIRRGEWKTQQQIPTESELCDLYDTSRITVRQAVRELISDGLLSPLRGKGTFVNEPSVTAGEGGLNSFTQATLGLGQTAGTLVLEQFLSRASPEVARQLRIDPGDDVVEIKRLRLGDSTPIGIQTAHLVGRRFPGLEDAPLSGASLYEYLRGHYSVRPQTWEETFRVGRASRRDARLLECASGFCCFFGERTTSDEEGVFELTYSVMRGDRYQVHLSVREPG